MAWELPSYSPSYYTIAVPLTSLLYDPLRTAEGLTTTEQRYAQLEKERLAIVAAFKKIPVMAFGKIQHRVHIDHQPLQPIFKKDLAHRLNSCRR